MKGCGSVVPLKQFYAEMKGNMKSAVRAGLAKGFHSM